MPGFGLELAKTTLKLAKKLTEPTTESPFDYNLEDHIF